MTCFSYWTHFSISLSILLLIVQSTLNTDDQVRKSWMDEEEAPSLKHRSGSRQDELVNSLTREDQHKSQIKYKKEHVIRPDGKRLSTILRNGSGLVWSLTELPNEIDYRDQGYVTSVDNQRACGACWAFSVAGAVEGLMAKATGKLEKLSAQQLLDCSDRHDDCTGGSTPHAMMFAKIYGLQKDSDYPYVAKKQACKLVVNKPEFRFKEFVHKIYLDEPNLKRVVGTAGPVVTNLVIMQSFRNYKSGIYSTTECQPGMKRNHAVLIVGYGVEKASGKEYWLIKNTFGSDWGEEGFMRFERNKNLCAIGTYVVWPLLT